MDRLPEDRRLRMKSHPTEQLELVTFRNAQLNACHVGRHQAHGCIEDAVMQGAKVAVLDQQWADLMQLQRVVQPFSYVFATLGERHTRLLKHDTTPQRRIGQPTLQRLKETGGRVADTMRPA